MFGKRRPGFSNSGNIPRFHRRQRMNKRRLMLYILEYFGDQLYYIGASFERECKNTLRSVRLGTKRFFRTILKAFGFLFRTLGRWIATVWGDFINPFTKAYRSLIGLAAAMKETKKQGFRAKIRRLGFFFKYGWMWNKHLLGRFMNNLLPLAAAAALIFVVYGVLQLDYALAVSYEGEVIGYVANEQIVESAYRIIQGRMIEADNTWKLDAQLSLAVVMNESLMSQSKTADNMLMVSGIGITEATGLYIDDVFYGAAADSDQLLDSIESLLAPYKDQVDEGLVNIRFVRDVELIQGVYPEVSVRTNEEFNKVLHSSGKAPIRHIIGEDENADSIADLAGITVEELQYLNPASDMENLSAGEYLVLAKEEPLLAVRVIRTEERMEEIPVEEEIYSDPKFSKDYSFEYVAGEAGQKIVTYEIEYENDVAVKRTVVGEVVTKEMIKRTIVVGSKAPSGVGGKALPSSGILGWPTGNYIYISRGSLGGSHIAIDIAADYYTNVYAAESGTVVQCSWTDYGYGYYIEIDHGMIDGTPLRTLYAHNSELLVEVGQRVERGQLIALSGSTGNSTGPHLHFEVRVGNEKVPPEPWLGLEMMGDRW